MSAERWRTFAHNIAAAGDRISEVLVFDRADGRGGVTTSAASINAMKSALQWQGSTTAIGGGTRANFRELAEQHLATGLDTVTFAISPTVHATDDVTVVENLETLPLLVSAARRMAADMRLDVVLALRQRINPYRATPSHAADSFRFDERLHTGFGAAWLISAVARLALAGAERLTLFEAGGEAGWTAVQGSATTEVLALLAQGDELLEAVAGSPISRLTVRRGQSAYVVVSNLSYDPIHVTLEEATFAGQSAAELVAAPRSATIWLVP